jgi:hypothetical protein
MPGSTVYFAGLNEVAENPNDQRRPLFHLVQPDSAEKGCADSKDRFSFVSPEIY